MKTSWNKGFTKDTHPSVRKISNTMRARRIDNFKKWRDLMIQRGKIKVQYSPLIKSGNLAELIGVVLGDGHICSFPRTESLRIVSNSNNPGFVRRYTDIMGQVFGKTPHVGKRTHSNAINITLYEKHISTRLGISPGARAGKIFPIPRWIAQERKYSVAYLRGLYEAEGMHAVHKKTYTYKMIFSNTNNSLLNNVFHLLRRLEFHPHRSRHKVQISRKAEVHKLKNLLQFRSY